MTTKTFSSLTQPALLTASRSLRVRPTVGPKSSRTTNAAQTQSWSSVVTHRVLTSWEISSEVEVELSSKTVFSLQTPVSTSTPPQEERVCWPESELLMEECSLILRNSCCRSYLRRCSPHCFPAIQHPHRCRQEWCLPTPS